MSTRRHASAGFSPLLTALAALHFSYSMAPTATAFSKQELIAGSVMGWGAMQGRIPHGDWDF